MKKIITPCLVALIPAILSFPVPAQDDDKRADRFKVRFGAFFVRNTDTQIRLDQTNGALGTTIDYERDLDVDDSDDVGRLDGYYRFKPRHRFAFGFYNIERDGTNVTTRPISFGDAFFPAGTTVQSFMDGDNLKLSYLYSFFQDERIELAVGGGLHFTEVDTGMSTPTGAIQDQADGTAPLPVLSVGMNVKLNPKLDLVLDWDFFFIEDTDGEYEGSWTDMRFLLEHRTFKHVGFGGGLNVWNFDIEAEDDDLIGRFETRWNGWYLYTFVY